MSSGVSKSGISSSITVIITIILALVVLGVGLGMVSKAKPVHSVDDLIKQTWDLFSESEENNDNEDTITCAQDRSSPEYNFIVRKGDLDKSVIEHNISTIWKCDVPGGVGNCQILEAQRDEEIKRSGVQDGRCRCDLSVDNGVGFSDSETVSDIRENWKIVEHTANVNKNLDDGEIFSIWSMFHTETFSSGLTGMVNSWIDDDLPRKNYEFNFTYRYCCPENYEWNTNLNACCPTDEDDCTPYAEINNFTEYCANSEKTSGKSLLEKINCGVQHTSDCNEDAEDMAPDCTAFSDSGNPFVSSSNVMCLDELGSSHYCTRDGVQTGQCLRLNFKNYYGNSVYVKDLWFRSGSNGGHDDLYVFGCYDGSCNNDGGGWNTIGEDVEGYNVLNHVFVDKKVDMIDICPQKASRDHKIAWVKFTTNESITPPPCEQYQECIDHGLENGGTICYVDNDGHAYKLECTVEGGCVKGALSGCMYGCNDDNSGCAPPPQPTTCNRNSDCNSDYFCSASTGKCEEKKDNYEFCENSKSQYNDLSSSCKSGVCEENLNVFGHSLNVCVPQSGYKICGAGEYSDSSEYSCDDDCKITVGGIQIQTPEVDATCIGRDKGKKCCGNPIMIANPKACFRSGTFTDDQTFLDFDVKNLGVLNLNDVTVTVEAKDHLDCNGVFGVGADHETHIENLGDIASGEAKNYHYTDFCDETTKFEIDVTSNELSYKFCMTCNANTDSNCDNNGDYTNCENPIRGPCQ